MADSKALVKPKKRYAWWESWLRRLALLGALVNAALLVQQGFSWLYFIPFVSLLAMALVWPSPQTLQELRAAEKKRALGEGDEGDS